MKLSEAIFLGSTLRPQIFGRTRDQQGTCAIGAAQDALGIDSGETKFSQLYPWAFPDNRRAACTDCCLGGSVISLIVHLNDDHHWTRERIADWVASIEPPETVSTPTEAKDPVCTDPAEMECRPCSKP